MKVASPFEKTVFISWTNCSKDSNGSYMLESDAYEGGAYQSFKSCWKVGGAELFRDKILDFLRDIKTGI